MQSPTAVHTRRVDMYMLGVTLYVALFCIGPQRLHFAVAAARNGFLSQPAFHAWAARSPEGGDFMRRILDPDDPQNRMRARHALAMPWLA